MIWSETLSTIGISAYKYILYRKIDLSIVCCLASSGNYCMYIKVQQEEFEDTKGAIRIRKSKKNRQYNDKKEKGKTKSQKLLKKMKNEWDNQGTTTVDFYNIDRKVKLCLTESLLFALGYNRYIFFFLSLESIDPESK